MARPTPSPEALREFAGRRWDLVGRAKRELVAERYSSRPRIRELLALLEQALDQSDLLPAFERCACGRVHVGTAH